MRYFKREDFNKCKDFLKGKPNTVETQQELYKFMHEECRMKPDWLPITVKDFTVYTNVYKTATICPETANWCSTISNGSQVAWNRKYQEFYKIDEVGTDHCSRLNYLDMFPELRDIDKWLLENWTYFWFKDTQKQLIAIWNGNFSLFYRNYWR